MGYRLQRKTSGRLARLEAVITTGKTRDVMTDEELDAGISSELWSLLVTGSLRINTAGKWCLPMLYDFPASHVPQELVDALNRPGALRDFAEAVAASGDDEYSLTDDEGREFTHGLLPA